MKLELSVVTHFGRLSNVAVCKKKDQKTQFQSSFKNYFDVKKWYTCTSKCIVVYAFIFVIYKYAWFPMQYVKFNFVFLDFLFQS